MLKLIRFFGKNVRSVWSVSSRLAAGPLQVGLQAGPPVEDQLSLLPPDQCTPDICWPNAKAGLWKTRLRPATPPPPNGRRHFYESQKQGACFPHSWLEGLGLTREKNVPLSQTDGNIYLASEGNIYLAGGKHFPGPYTEGNIFLTGMKHFANLHTDGNISPASVEQLKAQVQTESFSRLLLALNCTRISTSSQFFPQIFLFNPITVQLFNVFLILKTPTLSYNIMHRHARGSTGEHR